MMIETQRQYDHAIGQVANPSSTIRSMAVAIEQLAPTIEALRRFARAHEKLDNARIGAVESLSHDEYNALVMEFRSARDALPDWLLEARR